MRNHGTEKCTLDAVIWLKSKKRVSMYQYACHIPRRKFKMLPSTVASEEGTGEPGMDRLVFLIPFGIIQVVPLSCISPVVYFDRVQQNRTNQSCPLTSYRPETRSSYQLQVPWVKRLFFLICIIGLPKREWLLEKL